MREGCDRAGLNQINQIIHVHHCLCEIVTRIAFQVHVLTNTINVLVGQTMASVQKIHYGCFKIVRKAVKCVREFMVSG